MGIQDFFTVTSKDQENFGLSVHDPFDRIAICGLTVPLLNGLLF